MTGEFRCETCGSVLVGTPLSCPSGHPVPPPTGPTAPPGLAPRPDPYAQITNPLHTNWGQDSAGAAQDATPPAIASPTVARPPSATPPPTAPAVSAQPPVTAPAPPGLAPRPDPYSQITNPLHSDWGRAPEVAAPAMAPPAPARQRRRRGPWLRRAVAVVVLALLAGGLWIERDRVGDLAHDLGERISGESALQD